MGVRLEIGGDPAQAAGFCGPASCSCSAADHFGGAMGVKDSGKQGKLQRKLLSEAKHRTHRCRPPFCLECSDMLGRPLMLVRRMTVQERADADLESWPPWS